MRAMRVGAMCLLGALCGIGAAGAQEAPHRITAQEVAEALADPSANISYFNVSYRNLQDAGPWFDSNHEMRLNGAGFVRVGETSVMYRAYLPLYATNFVVDDAGMGDALLSAYWVPKKGDFILGYGAALITPSASEGVQLNSRITPLPITGDYGTGKWSGGPTLVIAKKVPGKYTLGGLLTHVWSFAGHGDRAEVSTSTIQPALSYFVGRGRSISLMSETTYNWKAEQNQWQVPLTLGLGQILPPFGKFFLGVGVGGTWYIERSNLAPRWDLRGSISIVLPS